MNSIINKDATQPEHSQENNRVAYMLFSILGLAFALRIWGISFGLPFDFTPDEVHEIVRALKLGTGEYSWTPGKGGLYYFLFVEYGILYVLWWIGGVVSSPKDFAILYLQDPTPFYIAGRVTVAVMGTLTCYVVYLVGRNLYDWRTGMVAAFVGATAYFHAYWSHYINVDIGMTLAVWAAILCYIIYEKDNRLRWLIGAGVFSGIAFAFKLPGAVVVVPLLLAISTPLNKWSKPRIPLKEGLVVLLAMFFSSLVIAPENILSVRGIHTQFSELLASTTSIESTAESRAQTEAFDRSVREVTVLHGGTYLKIMLRDTNLMLTLGALLGAALGLWRRSRWDMIWISFILIFIAVMTAADRPGTERYMLPIVPALWILAARATTTVAGSRNLVIPLLLAIIIAFPLYANIKQNYLWTRPDTRIIAKEWIEENVPSGSKVLMDGMRYRFIQSPPLKPDESTVNRRIGRAEGAESVSRGVTGSMLDTYAEAMAELPGPKYNLFSTIYGLNVRELSYYIEECFDYIVTSSFDADRYDSSEAVEQYPVSARYYEELPKNPLFRKVFSSEPVAWHTQGPEITVYEVLHDCS